MSIPSRVLWLIPILLSSPVAHAGESDIWHLTQEKCLLDRAFQVMESDPNQPNRCSKSDGVTLMPHDEQKQLTDLLCRSPRAFCDAFRKSEEEGKLAFGSDSECNPSVFNLLQWTDSSAEQEGIQKSNAADPTENVKQKVERSFALARASIREALSSPELTVPAEMLLFLDRIRLASDEEIQKHGFCAGEGEDGRELPLGIFQANASPTGEVIVCPLTALVLNEASLTFTLLHELAHFLDSCLTGARLVSQARPPECRVFSPEQIAEFEGSGRGDFPEKSSQLRDWEWMSRVASLQNCFQDAGIRSGKDHSKTLLITADLMELTGLSRSVLTQRLGCMGDIVHRAPRQLSGSGRDGLLSSCDPSFFHDFNSGLIGVVENAGLANEQPKLQKWLAQTRKKIKKMQQRPRENQFNEALADRIAARAFPLATRKLSARQSVEDLRKDWISGISLICSAEPDKKLRGEAHLHDADRIEWMLSSPQLRGWLGCEQREPRRLGFRRAVEGCPDKLMR